MADTTDLAPTTHAPDQVAIVLARLEEGKDLTEIAREPGMPSRATLYRMASDLPEVRRALACAREAKADDVVAEAGAILDAVDPDAPKGVGSARVALAAQRSGFKRWLAGCYARDLYGDRPPVVAVQVNTVVAAFGRLSSPKADVADE